MLKVGIAGMGTMGLTHLGVYAKRKDVRVVAVADPVAERREGRTAVAGNIRGQAQGGADFRSFRQYADVSELIEDPDIGIVDLCLPTPLHAPAALAALEAGKHVLVEKPFARTAREAAELARAAARAPTVLMCAMCMRFWPGWDWLKAAIERGVYGRVLAAHFRRVTSLPGGSFFRDGKASGGALLDLHIHDTDFVLHCFGKPRAVFSRGYVKETGAVDHVLTHYLYNDVPLVTAEGGWTMAPGFGFQMHYTVNFEKATAQFDLGAAEPLRLVQNGKRRPIKIRAGMGYAYEIAYFLDCVRKGRQPHRVTCEEAALAVAVVEAEDRSIRTGRPERV